MVTWTERTKPEHYQLMPGLKNILYTSRKLMSPEAKRDKVAKIVVPRGYVHRQQLLGVIFIKARVSKYLPEKKTYTLKRYVHLFFKIQIDSLTIFRMSTF